MLGAAVFLSEVGFDLLNLVDAEADDSTVPDWSGDAVPLAAEKGHFRPRQRLVSWRRVRRPGHFSLFHSLRDVSATLP